MPSNKPTEVDSMNRLRVQAENKAALYRRALVLACNGDEDQVAYFVSEAGTAIDAERECRECAIQPCDTCPDGVTADAEARYAELLAAYHEACADAARGCANWQPIATLPKDGREVILREGSRVGAACWIKWPDTYDYDGAANADGGEGWTIGYDGDEWRSPTGWQPMPPATGVAAVDPSFRHAPNCGTRFATAGECTCGVPACVGIDVALALPGVERLREWAAIGPVQRAAVEAFAACVAPRDEAEKLDALRQTLEIIAVGDSHHPKADADAALRATGFWRAATHGVAPTDNIATVVWLLEMVQSYGQAERRRDGDAAAKWLQQIEDYANRIAAAGVKEDVK